MVFFPDVSHKELQKEIISIARDNGGYVSFEDILDRHKPEKPSSYEASGAFWGNAIAGLHMNGIIRRAGHVGGTKARLFYWPHPPPIRWKLTTQSNLILSLLVEGMNEIN